MSTKLEKEILSKYSKIILDEYSEKKGDTLVGKKIKHAHIQYDNEITLIFDDDTYLIISNNYDYDGSLEIRLDDELEISQLEEMGLVSKETVRKIRDAKRKSEERRAKKHLERMLVSTAEQLGKDRAKKILEQ